MLFRSKGDDKKGDKGDDKEGDKANKTKHNSIFAVFKNYNKENIKIDNMNTNNNTVVRDEGDHVENEKKVNRYTYRGKLEEYEDTKSDNDDEIIKVDFASFKKMMQDRFNSEDADADADADAEYSEGDADSERESEGEKVESPPLPMGWDSSIDSNEVKDKIGRAHV